MIRAVVTLAGAAFGLAVGLLIGFLYGAAQGSALVVDTFTDGAGRACTQAGQGSSLALDCDYPPAEDRLSRFLHDLSSPTP